MRSAYSRRSGACTRWPPENQACLCWEKADREFQRGVVALSKATLAWQSCIGFTALRSVDDARHSCEMQHRSKWAQSRPSMRGGLRPRFRAGAPWIRQDWAQSRPSMRGGLRLRFRAVAELRSSSDPASPGRTSPYAGALPPTRFKKQCNTTFLKHFP